MAVDGNSTKDPRLSPLSALRLLSLIVHLLQIFLLSRAFTVTDILVPFLQVDGSTDYAANDVFGSLRDSNSGATISSVDQQQSNFQQFSSGLNGAQQASYMPSTSNSTHVVCIAQPLCQSPSDDQQLQHHLYAPLDAYSQNLKPYQRSAKDVFISEDLRQRLHKKQEATLRSFASGLQPV